MGVDCNSYQVLEHVRYQSVQQGTANLNAGVFIALYKPNVELFINQKVKTEQLKLLDMPSHYKHASLEQNFCEIFYFLIHF